MLKWISIEKYNLKIRKFPSPPWKCDTLFPQIRHKNVTFECESSKKI